MPTVPICESAEQPGAFLPRSRGEQFHSALSVWPRPQQSRRFVAPIMSSKATDSRATSLAPTLELSLAALSARGAISQASGAGREVRDVDLQEREGHVQVTKRKLSRM